jgi:hypothetical protein
MSGAASSHDDHAAAHPSGDQGHHADAHGDDHGHGDALGPIDWRAWGAAVLGVASGLLVVAVMLVTIQPD